MITGIYETLRSAGRDLVLELGESPPIGERLEELREAARCLVEDGGSATELQRGSAAALNAVSGEPRADDLLDLSAHRARGERSASFEEARVAIGRRRSTSSRWDRILQQLLDGFAEAYAAAKRRESALDFEDLQLAARALLRDNPEIRERRRCASRRSWWTSFRTPIASSATSSDSPAGSRASDSSSGESRADRSASSSATVPPIYGFRHADVSVFARRESGGRRRPASSRTTAPGRRCSRPSTTCSEGDFGEGFQKLTASGEPGPGLRASGRAARSTSRRTPAPARTGAGRRRGTSRAECAS